MKKHFILGLDIFFETQEDNLFAYTFKDGRLETRNSVSDNVLLLAEEVNKFEYDKQLSRRISYFSKTFK
jgi:hypothetical protein